MLARCRLQVRWEQGVLSAIVAVRRQRREGNQGCGVKLICSGSTCKLVEKRVLPPYLTPEFPRSLRTISHGIMSNCQLLRCDPNAFQPVRFSANWCDGADERRGASGLDGSVIVIGYSDMEWRLGRTSGVRARGDLFFGT